MKVLENMQNFPQQEKKPQIVFFWLFTTISKNNTTTTFYDILLHLFLQPTTTRYTYSDKFCLFSSTFLHKVTIFYDSFRQHRLILMSPSPCYRYQILQQVIISYVLLIPLRLVLRDNSLLITIKQTKKKNSFIFICRMMRQKLAVSTFPATPLLFIPTLWVMHINFPQGQILCGANFKN